MSTPDDPRSRRAISALSHSKPKPYRRALADEPFRLSRVQIALLALGATVIAGLILTVAVIAQEHANATRGKEIITAQAAASAPPVQAVAARPLTFPDVPPPMLDDSALPIPAPRTPPLREPPAGAGMAQELTLPRTVPAALLVLSGTSGPSVPAPPPRATARLALHTAVVPDPDVDLIATILQLTPPPEPADLPNAVCTPAEVLDNTCGIPRGMRP